MGSDNTAQGKRISGQYSLCNSMEAPLITFLMAGGGEREELPPVIGGGDI